VNAVITKRTTEATQGQVFYDAECPLCISAVARFALMLRRHHFDLAPLQMPWAQKRLGLRPGEPLVEMKLLTENGRIYGGADALAQIARRIWWAWPLFALTQIPGTTILWRKIYQRIAANRNCIGNACQLPKQNRLGDYLPLILLPILALLTRNIFPAWVFMWVLAFSLYFGCKWLTWQRAMRGVSAANKLLSFGYLFGWVGMDAKKFLQDKRADFTAKPSDWLLAMAKILSDVMLVWFVARHFVERQPLVAGWIGNEPE
jgi:predicted DCC family thiol-disulfide oxidoreductase YuxK